MQQKVFLFSNMPKAFWQKHVNILGSKDEYNTVEFFRDALIPINKLPSDFQLTIPFGGF